MRTAIVGREKGRTAIVKRERKVQIERRGKGEDSYSGKGQVRAAIVERER